LDAIAERITRFSNSTGDGTCERAAQLLRILSAAKPVSVDAGMTEYQRGAVETAIRIVKRANPSHARVINGLNSLLAAHATDKTEGAILTDRGLEKFK
jgi:hypothetical protein